MQMRHELKHIINYHDHSVLRHRLGALFPTDSHAGAHGEYRVRSLYFDNWKDKVLAEKINGMSRREKFRIRFYDNDLSFIRLEKKVKINGLCTKKSTLLTRGQVQQILNGDTRWMQQSGDGLLVELYSKILGQLLRPRVIVDYIRTPYLYAPGNVRLTLDRDIRTGMRPGEFLDENTPLLQAGEQYAVLEVKYDAFIPEIVLDAVRLPNRRAGALSKYAACRRFG